MIAKEKNLPSLEPANQGSRHCFSLVINKKDLGAMIVTADSLNSNPHNTITYKIADYFIPPTINDDEVSCIPNLEPNLIIVNVYLKNPVNLQFCQNFWNKFLETAADHKNLSNKPV